MDGELIKKYVALKAEFLEYFGQVASGLNLLARDLAEAGRPFDAQNEHRYRLTVLREQALHLAGKAEELMQAAKRMGLVVTTKGRIDGFEKLAESTRRVEQERDRAIKDRFNINIVFSDESDAGDMLTWLLYHPEWQAKARAEAKNTVIRPEAYRAYMLKQLQAAMREG